MNKLKLKAVSLGAVEILSREELEDIVEDFGSGSTGGSGSDHEYKCRDVKCKLVNTSGVAENGDCAWHLDGPPVCFCKTNAHPTPQKTKRPSVCIMWLS